MRPWECPRCRKVNAPWLNQCYCGPLVPPKTDPPGIPVGEYGYGPVPTDVELTATGSWVLRMDDE